jgi:hypothetical protein
MRLPIFWLRSKVRLKVHTGQINARVWPASIPRFGVVGFSSGKTYSTFLVGRTMLVVVRRKHLVMSSDDELWATDYYNYPDPVRNVEHEVPPRPIGNLFNTIQLEEEDVELV